MNTENNINTNLTPQIVTILICFIIFIKPVKSFFNTLLYFFLGDLIKLALTDNITTTMRDEAQHQPTKTSQYKLPNINAFFSPLHKSKMLFVIPQSQKSLITLLNQDNSPLFDIIEEVTHGSVWGVNGSHTSFHKALLRSILKDQPDLPLKFIDKNISELTSDNTKINIKLFSSYILVRSIIMALGCHYFPINFEEKVLNISKAMFKALLNSFIPEGYKFLFQHHIDKANQMYLALVREMYTLNRAAMLDELLTSNPSSYIACLFEMHAKAQKCNATDLIDDIHIWQQGLMAITGIDSFTRFFELSLIQLIPCQNDNIADRKQLSTLIGHIVQEGEQGMTLRKFYYECLRMHLPAPLTIRKAKSHFNLNGQMIHQGDSLIIDFKSNARNAQLWHNPSKFDLNNIPDQTHQLSDLPSLFTPFSTGNHPCMGKHIVKQTFLHLIYKLISEFDLEPINQTRNQLIVTDNGISTVNSNISIQLKKNKHGQKQTLSR